MIDDGELDWKVIAINAEDPKAASVNDIEDVERCELILLPEGAIHADCHPCCPSLPRFQLCIHAH